MGSQLDKASATFQEARKKLHTGKGNVISQALKMKGKLQHNKPAGELPQGLVEEAEAGEDEVYRGDHRRSVSPDAARLK